MPEFSAQQPLAPSKSIDLLRLSILPPDNASFDSFAISPDGRKLAFTAPSATRPQKTRRSSVEFTSAWSLVGDGDDEDTLSDLKEGSDENGRLANQVHLGSGSAEGSEGGIADQRRAIVEADRQD